MLYDQGSDDTNRYNNNNEDNSMSYKSAYTEDNS